MNRLREVVGGGGRWEIDWTLDAWGNRTAQTRSGLAATRVGAQTLGYTNNRNNAFTYDSAGNVTNDTVRTYAYDAENRLISVNSGAVTYAYDGEGRRVKRTARSITTFYFYGLTGLLSEFSSVNTGATAAHSTNRLTYRVSEHNGTGVLLVDPSGLMVENNRASLTASSGIRRRPRRTTRSSRRICAGTAPTSSWIMRWPGTTRTGTGDS